MNEEEITAYIQYATEEKDNIIRKLLDIITTTNNPKIRIEAGFFLVDHFRDDRIVNTLKRLIEREDLYDRNATLLYILSIYSNSSEYLSYAVNVFLNSHSNEGLEQAAYGMILDMCPPFKQSGIKEALRKLKKELDIFDSNKTKRKLTQNLLAFLETQQEIAEFYDEYQES